MAACGNDQLSASQYISAIPKIIKSGRLADDVDAQQPLNAIRLLEDGMMMTHTSSAPGVPDAGITRLDLSALGLSSDMSRKKYLHYILHDSPAPGWAKQIIVRSDIAVKSVGHTSIRYIPPDGGRIIRSKVDALSYLAQNKNVSKSVVDELDFRSASCVCHCPEDNTEYIHCACGLGGCNHWFHAQCAGMTSDDVKEFKKSALVCPLCTAYLEATGNAAFLLNKWAIRPAPFNPSSYNEKIFKLPSAAGTALQRRESNIYVNGLVFKPAMSWKTPAVSTGKDYGAKGKKRKARADIVMRGQPNHTPLPREETPHSVLNEDDFLQLEAFLSPCDDPIESIGSINYMNGDGHVETAPEEEESTELSAEHNSTADSSYVASEGVAEVDDSSYDGGVVDDE